MASPLKIMNMMADLVSKKKKPAAPDADSAGDAQEPSNPQSKKVAAMKEQEKTKGVQPPKKSAPMGLRQMKSKIGQ